MHVQTHQTAMPLRRIRVQQPLEGSGSGALDSHRGVFESLTALVHRG